MLPRHLERIVNPNGGVVYRRVAEEQFSNDPIKEQWVKIHYPASAR